MYSVLVGGMILSSVTYIIGIILFLLQNPSQATITHYQTLTEFMAGLVTGQSAAVLTLATVILIGTPITRVFVSILAFAANRNRKYVAVTVLVLLILISSILLGYVGHFNPE
jgi:uncharacterized membrane protein